MIQRVAEAERKGRRRMKMTRGRRAYPSESRGCTMGAVGTADPSPFSARTQAVCLASRDCQCHLVRAQEWMPLAHAAPGVSQVANRLLRLSPVGAGRSLGSHPPDAAHANAYETRARRRAKRGHHRQSIHQNQRRSGSRKGRRSGEKKYGEAFATRS